MKQTCKIFLYLTMVLIGFTACKDEEVVAPVLEIATSEVSFNGAVDGTQVLDVTTNRKVEAKSNFEWCTTAISEGEATRLTISVSANPDATDRTAIVTVTATGTQLAPVEIKVTQTLTPQIIVAKEDLSLQFTGDTDIGKNIHVQTTGDKPFTAISSEDWCKVAVSKAYLTVSLTAMPGASARTAEITLSSEGMADLIITIEQAAFTGIITIGDATQLAYHVKGETNTSVYVTLNANFPSYSVTPDQSWCTVSKFATEARHQIKLAAAKNETGVARTANITITGGQEPIVVTLTQDAANHQAGYPRFAVLSDTHFDNTEGGGETATVKVSRALKNLVAKGNLDAMFVVGDITNDATDVQYVHLVETFSNTENVPASLPVYYLLGNHDNFNGGGSGVEYRFLRNMHQAMNQYLEIKGYPFILISQTGSGASDYNHAAQRFLTESLADAAANYPGKPIFVFVHVPPRNTCYGSSDTDTWGSPIFPPLLSPYPQVIVFAGHSHFPIGDPRSIWQGEYTSVNDGSTNYTELEPNIPGRSPDLPQYFDETIHPVNYNKVTEGLIVNLTESGNAVVIERWDTRRDEEILPQWKVSAPYDGSNFPSEYKGRNGLPVPAFYGNSSDLITVTANSGKVTVTFPQAVDTEIVHHYIIDIKDGDNVLKTGNKFSQFYLNSETPDFLTIEFTGLPTDGRELKVEITALDSYYINKSVPIEKVFNSN
jgi:predicted MPP superfamily phosphohydrolase